MENRDLPTRKRTFGVLLAATGAVTVWKVTALALVFGAAEAYPDSLVVKALLALVGMVFPVCGLVVFWKQPSRTSLIFAWFSMCAGLHWGGPLALPPGELRTGLILFYLLVSSFLNQTLFLHFALRFPRRLGLVDRTSFVKLLYAPAGATTLLAAVYTFAPDPSGLRSGAESAFFLAHAVVPNLFAILVLTIFVAHLFRRELGRIEKKYVGLMVGGMLTAWLPYVIASSAGAATDPFNLTVVALPISFAIGILGIARVREKLNERPGR